MSPGSMRISEWVFVGAISALNMSGCSQAPQDTVNAASGAKLEVEFNSETNMAHIANKDQNVILDIHCPFGKQKADLKKITNIVKGFQFNHIDAMDSKAAVERLAKAPATGDCPALSASFNIEHGAEKKPASFSLSQDAKGTITASLEPEASKGVKAITVTVTKGPSGQCASEWKEEGTLKEFAADLSQISESFNKSYSSEGGSQKTLSV